MLNLVFLFYLFYEYWPELRGAVNAEVQKKCTERQMWNISQRIAVLSFCNLSQTHRLIYCSAYSARLMRIVIDKKINLLLDMELICCYDHGKL